MKMGIYLLEWNRETGAFDEKLVDRAKENENVVRDSVRFVTKSGGTFEVKLRTDCIQVVEITGAQAVIKPNSANDVSIKGKEHE